MLSAPPTVTNLASILARFTPDRVAALLDAPLPAVAAGWPLVASCLDALNILTPLVAIAALATIRVECPGFKPIREYGGERYFTQHYEGRKDLGNTEPGDGARFCGRGFIQITGRANYRHYGLLLGVNLEANPDAALEVNAAAAIFASYFKDHGVHVAADSAAWGRVRRLVNGGTNGLEAFLGYVSKLQSLL